MTVSIENHVPYLVARVAALVREAVAPILAEYDITLPMWRVLATLAANGEQTTGSLLIATALEQSTLSRTITALERRGFVSKKTIRGDARSITVRLLAAGRAFNDRLVPHWIHQHATLTAGVAAADLEVFKGVLDTLYANISAATNSPTAKMRTRARTPASG
jgi:DNA-binding MarR family transcriptional regulator